MQLFLLHCNIDARAGHAAFRTIRVPASDNTQGHIGGTFALRKERSGTKLA